MSIERMPSRFLYTGEARKHYARLCAASGYAPNRANLAAELVRRMPVMTRSRLVLLGPGPDVSTELAVVHATAAQSVLVVDCFEAEEAAAAIRGPTFGLCNVTACERDFETAGRFPTGDLTCALGYTVGNFTDAGLSAFLHKVDSPLLLLDCPLASNRDPRLLGESFDIGTACIEADWMLSAANGYLQGDPPSIWWRVIPDGFTDYSVIYFADTASRRRVEILRFTRRTAAGWLAVFAESGFQPVRLEVSDGIVPRMAVLLRSVI